MKLAEALILRADLQKRIEQLKNRLNRNAKVQEEEKPSEEPSRLFAELDQMLSQLEDLIKKINKTNSHVTFDGNKKISDALAERDMLALHRNIVQDVIHHASIKQDRFTKSEVKYYATVDIAALQREADQLAKKYRELDTRIQELNWKTDLME